MNYLKWRRFLFILVTYLVCSLATGQDAKQESLVKPRSVVAYEGYSSVNDGYTLRIDEGFDAADLDLWTWGDGTFQENICTFDKSGIEFNNGMMELSIMPVAMPAHLSFTASDKNGPREVGHRNFRCGELQSKDEFRYGILEVRMKTPRTAAGKKNTGFIASMFTFHQSDQNLWEEIDYEVQAQFDDRFTSNLIFGKHCTNWLCTRAWGSWEAYTDSHGSHGPETNRNLQTPLNYSHSGDFHVIKIVWHPDYIQWYLDGVKYRELSNVDLRSTPAVDDHTGVKNEETHVPNNYAKIMFNFWLTNTGKAFGGMNSGNEYPMKTQYDWFRYYSLDGYDQVYSRRPSPPFDYGYIVSNKKQP